MKKFKIAGAIQFTAFILGFSMFIIFGAGTVGLADMPPTPETLALPFSFYVIRILICIVGMLASAALYTFGTFIESVSVQRYRRMLRTTERNTFKAYAYRKILRAVED